MRKLFRRSGSRGLCRCRHAAGKDPGRRVRQRVHTLPPDLDGLRHGDLVFWKDHVGMMRDPGTLIHANGHHMSVAVEPLRGALARIAEKSFGAVTALRRIPPPVQIGA